MAWKKAKTGVVAGVAVFCATGTTVVVVEKVVSPAVDESFWEMKAENWKRAPAVLIIRPTRYTDSQTMTLHSSEDKGGGKAIMHHTDLAGLLMWAYSIGKFRMIRPEAFPKDWFDLMLTLPDHQREALQKAIRRKFGFTGRRETRETDVLVLKVKDPGLLALHASKRGSKMDFKHDFKEGKSSWMYANFPITSEVEILEGLFFKPVIVPSELSGNYDLTFQWDDAKGMEAQLERERALSDQLAQAGLELVPSREPIEMLVVGKAH